MNGLNERKSCRSNLVVFADNVVNSHANVTLSICGLGILWLLRLHAEWSIWCRCFHNCIGGNNQEDSFRHGSSSTLGLSGFHCFIFMIERSDYLLHCWLSWLVVVSCVRQNATQLPDSLVIWCVPPQPTPASNVSWSFPIHNCKETAKHKTFYFCIYLLYAMRWIKPVYVIVFWLYIVHNIYMNILSFQCIVLRCDMYIDADGILDWLNYLLLILLMLNHDKNLPTFIWM